MTHLHQAVMTREVLEGLQPQDGGIYVDATFGAGGHTSAILQTAHCTVHAFDRDERAIALATTMQKQWGERLHVHHALWSDIAATLKEHTITKINGIVIDGGVSSMQLDEAERGFSFQQDGPLSMQMGKNESSAYDVVNHASQQELTDILRQYGHERRAQAIARAIVEQRAHAPIETTLQLAQLCGSKRVGHHPATRTFLALRLYVNDEVRQLKDLLHDVTHLLKVGGRVAYIGFHGTEDVVAKNFFKKYSRRQGTLSRLLPGEPRSKNKPPLYRMVSRHVVTPSADEIENNVRARSARLRVAERLGKPL